MADSYVFDAWPVIGWIRGEARASGFRACLDDLAAAAARGFMASVNLGEVQTRFLRLGGRPAAETALALVDRWGVEIVAADKQLALDASGLKVAERFGYSDAIAVALAKRLGATLVTGDPGLRGAGSVVDLLWLG